MRRILLVLVVLAAVVAGVWWFNARETGGAAGSTGSASDPLAFVPADTPYLFANVERMPQATVEAMLQQGEPMLAIWRSQLESLSEVVKKKDPDDQRAARWLDALLAEFEGKSVAQGLAAAGLDMQALSALYGVGVVPVARVSLADPDAFRAFVARLEQRAGESLPTGRLEEIEYWQFTAPGDEVPLRAVLALQGGHAVLTVAPVKDDAALRTLLGIERPARDLRDAGPLKELNQRYGFAPFGSGYVDLKRLVAELTGPATPLETAFLGALGVEKPAVDEVCRTEYAQLAAIMPRLVSGYVTLEPKRSHLLTRLELRSDIAQDLQTLRAPMPGLEAGREAMANFGISLEVGKLPGLIGKWAGAARSAPLRCADLAGLNQAADEIALQANNPAIYATAPVLRGFHAMLTRFEMAAADSEPDLSGKLLIGSPNPAALLGMARNFAPGLSELQLKPDGELQPLPPLPGAPAGYEGHVAMTANLLGIAIGKGEETGLKQAMQSDDAQQPLLVLGYSGAAFTRFFEQVQDKLPDAGNDDDARAEAERSVALMRQIYAMIGHIELRVELDGDGIAFHQLATMN